MTTVIFLSGFDATIPVWAPGTWGEVSSIFLLRHSHRHGLWPGNEKTERNLIDVVYAVKTESRLATRLKSLALARAICQAGEGPGWYPRRIEAAGVDAVIDWHDQRRAGETRRRRIG